MVNLKTRPLTLVLPRKDPQESPSRSVDPTPPPRPQSSVIKCTKRVSDFELRAEAQSASQRDVQLPARPSSPPAA